jgi:hypothetical protein
MRPLQSEQNEGLMVVIEDHNSFLASALDDKKQTEGNIASSWDLNSVS